MVASDVGQRDVEARLRPAEHVLDKNVSCAANRSGSKAKAAVFSPDAYSWIRSVSSSERWAPMIIVGGRSAASRTPPHDAISCPSPANTMASGAAGGTYAVTCRPWS